MAEPGGPMRLKEWLIAQIDSGRYPGLRWENRHRTLFRIPWKHAAKQDYRQQQDAALFKGSTAGSLEEESQKSTMESCHVSPLPLLSAHPAERELRGYLSHGQPTPQYQIHLCFGEEYPTSAGHHFQKLIMAHVEPVFARELFHHAQRMGPTLLRDSPQPCAPGTSSHIIRVLKQLCQP
ncbi:interferon regulatory factor 4-like [Limosa lapponica baueri]|uniref:Interferon regulatory factor 4-like n=1 Tax=Limosa lapponica baueri TaxID=1758121 RepID=A0A2I0TM58_LIMLA|nr:interferon regulatory factor 4-like [Limosa lapponica baueri]